MALALNGACYAKESMKKSALLALSLLGFVLSCWGQSVLSPFGVTSSGGNSVPFVPAASAFPSIRYQQVYGSADFRRVGGPFLITEIRFAAGIGSTHIDANLPNVHIELSTTGRNPDGLSSTFADNLGSDNMVVFSGPLHFYDRGINRFDIRIPLQTPFPYDPQEGNLLMDVRNFQVVPLLSVPRYMDAADMVGDTVSSQYAPDVNATTASTVDSLGLFTHFEVTIVPEPSTWALLLVGVIALMVGARGCAGRS